MDLFRSADTRRVGFHILDLPVTTADADAAGREIWGYPKFVTAIDFHLSGERFDSTVHLPAGDGFIMNLSGRLGPGLPCPSLDLVTFERRDGQDRRTVIQTRGAARLRLKGGLILKIGDRSHPMARRLDRLGLDGQRPLCLTADTAFQSRLNAGAPVGGA